MEIDETASEYGEKEEKSTGAQEKKATPPEGGSWADHTRVAQRPVGERLGKFTTRPKNKLCLLDQLGRTKRIDKTQGKEPGTEHEGGIQDEEQNE